MAREPKIYTADNMIFRRGKKGKSDKLIGFIGSDKQGLVFKAVRRKPGLRLWSYRPILKKK